MFQGILRISEYLYRFRELALMNDGKIPLMVQERANWPKKIGRNEPCPCGFGQKVQTMPRKVRYNKGKHKIEKMTNLLFVNRLNKMWTEPIENKGCQQKLIC